MRSMRDKRILGAVREWTPTYESLVPARGTVLFTLDYDPQFIKPDELLQVVNDSETAGMHPAEMKLYVKHPMAESARAR
jgi:hypothetical protein